MVLFLVNGWGRGRRASPQSPHNKQLAYTIVDVVNVADVVVGGDCGDDVVVANLQSSSGLKAEKQKVGKIIKRSRAEKQENRQAE